MSGPAGTAWPGVVRMGMAAEVAAGRRFAGLFGTARPEGLLLSAHLAGPGGGRARWRRVLPAGAAGYPALTPAAGRRVLVRARDRRHVRRRPRGPPAAGAADAAAAARARAAAAARAPGSPRSIEPDPRALPLHVTGPGLFTIPHGPVRSGVLESIEYLVETPGEDIPHLNMRVFYKHRGIEKRFEGTDRRPTACCWPSGSRARPRRARARLLPRARTDRRGEPSLARRAGPGRCTRNSSGSPATWTSRSGWPTRPAWPSATARFGWHKERVLRLVSRACGSRFGRGRRRARRGQRAAAVGPGELLAEIGRLDKAVTRRRRAADGHRVVPGPAAPHRAAAPGAGPRARRARAGGQGVGLRRRRRRAGPTTPTR